MSARAIETLKDIAGKHDNVTLYAPASVKSIMRTAGNLPGRLDQDLFDFYRQSNGASCLDYCIAGCKNGRLVDLAVNTRELWSANSWLAGKFVGFMLTSAGDSFGYIRDGERPDSGSHPVAYLPSSTEDRLLIIATSVEIFLSGFVADLAEALAQNRDAIYIESSGWPLNLSHWIERDPGLVDLYQSGRYDSFFRRDREFSDLIERGLSGSG